MTSGNEEWRKSPQAPAPGTSLGPLSDIPDGEAREYVFGTGRRVFSMLVVRRGRDARAYVNCLAAADIQEQQRRQCRWRAAGVLQPLRRVFG